MSDENVELVRRGWEAALRDPPDWDALEELMHPDHEMHTLVGLVEGARELRGVDGFRQFWERMNQTGDWTWDIVEIRAAPGGDVVVLGNLRMRAHQSGIELSAPRGMVHAIRDGKLARTEVFPTPEEALIDAGLSE